MNILLLEDNCTELQILYNILKKHWPQFHYTCCKIIMMLKNPFYQFSMIFLFLTYSSHPLPMPLTASLLPGISEVSLLIGQPLCFLAPAPLILSKNVLMKSTATITLKSPIMKLYWFMPWKSCSPHYPIRLITTIWPLNY